MSYSVKVSTFLGAGWESVNPNFTVCRNAQPWEDFCVQPPCGQVNTGLWLVNTDHVTSILDYYWSAQPRRGGDVRGAGDCVWWHARDVQVNTDLWLVQTSHVTRILAYDWSIWVTWPEYWSLIGQDKSRDQNTGLWLISTGHVTSILISDWLIRVTWPQYWSLIGQDKSRDLNTGLWLVRQPLESEARLGSPPTVPRPPS